MQPRTVVVVGYEGAELLDIASVTTTLALANGIGSPAVPYVIRLVSPGGRDIRCATTLELRAEGSLERVVGPLDTLVVSGGVGHERAAEDASLVGHVRRLARESRRVASVCTGASVLAAAGLLDGRRATTHWRYAAGMAASYPAVVVDPAPLFIRDGRVATSAGITSALDLALAFVEEDHGADHARAVARELVTSVQRPGHQQQVSMFTGALPSEHDVVRRVTDHVHTHLVDDLSTGTLSAMAGISPRHLGRLFRSHLGVPPGRYVRLVRTEAAARLLETTSLPLPRVAARCGLGTAENLRLAFTARYGRAPSAHRAAATGPGSARSALS